MPVPLSDTYFWGCDPMGRVPRGCGTPKTQTLAISFKNPPGWQMTIQGAPPSYIGLDLAVPISHHFIQIG
jgi:hypothetical protein